MFVVGRDHLFVRRNGLPVQLMSNVSFAVLRCNHPGAEWAAQMVYLKAQSISEAIERENRHAVKIDVLKSHWADVPKRRAVDLFSEFGMLSVECGLQGMCIPYDDEIGDECRRT